MGRLNEVAVVAGGSVSPEVEAACQNVLARTVDLEEAQRAVEAAATARAEAAWGLVKAFGGERGAQSSAAKMMGISTATMAVLLKKARPSAGI